MKSEREENGKTVHVVFTYLSKRSTGKKAPWIVHFKDDVTVILLLGVSFVLFLQYLV
jgi:hypothetical protein